MHATIEGPEPAVATVAENVRRFARDLRDSLAGGQREYTTGGIGRAVTLLAVPMALELSLEAVFAVCDVFFVGRLGADAVATVGLTEAILTIVFSIATGLSMGATALVSRRIGEKDRAAATTAAVQALFVGILVSIPISLLGFFLAGPLLAAMGASPEVVRVGGGYCRVMLVGNATIMLLFLINAVFRGAGDAAIAMRSLWIANLINLVLDPVLIFGLGPFPALGVTGAAVATTFARGVGVLFQLRLLTSRRSQVRITWRDLKLDRAVTATLLRVSTGGVLQFLIGTASWLGLVRIIARFGSTAVAGYTIAVRVFVVAILPSWGMANAAATLVGQNLGAGQPERAEKSVWVTGLANMVFLAIVTVVFVIWADAISAFFTTDAGVLPYAVDGLRLVSYGYVFYAWGMIVTQAFNGAGDTFTPTLINLCLYWLFQIPLAYLLAIPGGLEVRGVFLAIAIAESLLAVVGMLVFRRGKWKMKRV
jgi:putative MATE family efflux protein